MTGNEHDGRNGAGEMHTQSDNRSNRVVEVVATESSYDLTVDIHGERYGLRVMRCDDLTILALALLKSIDTCLTHVPTETKAIIQRDIDR